MDTTTLLCVLCDHPAVATDFDCGNRRYIECSSASCGDYEISRRAANDVAANPERKRSLKDIIVRANVEGKVLQIFVDAAGNFDTTRVKR